MTSAFSYVDTLFYEAPFLVLFYAALLLALVLLLTRRFWAGPFFAWYRRNYLSVSLSVLFALLVLVYLSPLIFFTVGPGEAGVLWSRFAGGTGLAYPYPEGTFVKWPWNRLYVYNVRFQRATTRIDATTVEGLRIFVVLTARFRVIEPRAGLLHKEVGPLYVSKLVMPELGAYARHVIARTTGEEVYGTRKLQVQEAIFRAMKEQLPIHYDRALNPGGPAGPAGPPGSPGRRRAQSTNFVELEDVLLESVILPPRVELAIESKFQQKLLLDEYVYRLARERQELERKGIEGEGIALFQSKVSEGISDRYLKWKGIDATLELAQSNNAKIVVVGSGRDGLPLILGGFGTDDPPGVGRAGAIGPQGGTLGRRPNAAAGAQGAATAPETARPTPGPAGPGQQ